METVSSWRATYAPGRWVVLAGPTSLVIMQPAPPHMSPLLSDLWEDVVSAADVSDLAGKFSAFRLDLMPHFAAFFWAEDGMHSLIRGGLRAVDAETGRVVAQGEGFHTWNEVGLSSVRQVRVEMDPPGDESVLALPLAVGVVLASSVTIDSTQKVSLVLPTTAAGHASAVVGPVESGEAPESGEDEPKVPAAPVVPVVALLPVVGALDEPAAADLMDAGEARATDAPDEDPDWTVTEVISEGSEPEEPAPAGDIAEDDALTFAADPSLPSATDDHAETSDEPRRAPLDENVAEDESPVEPESFGEQGDSWGVRSAEALAPVDLFVDENGDGIPDAEQSPLDLDLQQPDVVPDPFAFEVPAPQGPLPGWSRPAQNPYGQPQPGPYGMPLGQPPVNAPFPAPGLPSAPFGGPSQAPAVPGQSFPGQAYPGQPYPGQPFPGQPVQGQQQVPTYPPSPQYGGSMPPLGAPLTSPVPPPATYAPAAPPPQGPAAPSEPGLPVSADSADSDGTVFSTDIAMTHKPAVPRVGSDNLILAVVCAFGHPNPLASLRCRVCGQPVDNANPRLVHKPVLAQLITAGGAHIEVTDSVLIGRAPSAQPGDGNPILLPIPSPNSDISRTHLKVAAKDWDIVATDLHSTNGTMLVRPGQAPVRMMPGTPVTVDPGTILDLGDGGVITVGLPE